MAEPAPGRSLAPVTCVIPLYDGARFIAEALASVAGQTRPPAEIIVIDDGSGDAGPRIVEEGWPQVRLIRQANAGEAAARNRGIAAARQPFIGFLDQDDLWLPDKLARQLAAFEAAPGCDFVLGHYDMFVDPSLEGRLWLDPSFIGPAFPGYVPGALLVRRQALARLGRFDETMPMGSDADWFFRVRDRGAGFVILPDLVLRRRIHDANASRNKPLAQAMLLRAAHRSILAKRGAA